MYRNITNEQLTLGLWTLGWDTIVWSLVEAIHMVSVRWSCV